MKKIILLLLSALILTSCGNKGEFSQKLNGDENLPDHIKGLVVDHVCVGGGEWIYVGTLPNHNTTSIKYKDGKTSEYVIIISDEINRDRTIRVKEIMMENDSMILIKKENTK